MDKWTKRTSGQNGQVDRMDKWTKRTSGQNGQKDRWTDTHDDNMCPKTESQSDINFFQIKVPGPIEIFLGRQWALKRNWEAQGGHPPSSIL